MLEAEAKSKQRLCDARQQAAETKKGQMDERGDDYYARQRCRRGAEGPDEQ